MADLVVTAANVALAAGGKVEDGTVGEAALTVGMSVYRKTSDGKWYGAQHDGTLAESGGGTGGRVGVLLAVGPGADQPCRVALSGGLNPGATVTVGTIYAVGAGKGGIAPVADLISTKYVSILGVGTTASNIKLDPIISGVQVP